MTSLPSNQLAKTKSTVGTTIRINKEKRNLIKTTIQTNSLAEKICKPKSVKNKIFTRTVKPLTETTALGPHKNE